MGAVAGIKVDLRLHQERGGAAVDQQRRDIHRARGSQQAVRDLNQASAVQVSRARALVTAHRSRALRGRERMHFVAACGVGGRDGALKRALQTVQAQVRRGGVAKVAVHQHLAHRALFQTALVFFGQIVTDDTLSRRLRRMPNARPLNCCRGRFERMINRLLKRDFEGNFVVLHQESKLICFEFIRWLEN